MEKRLEEDEMKDEGSRTETKGDKTWKERKGKRDGVIRDRKGTGGKEVKEKQNDSGLKTSGIAGQKAARKLNLSYTVKKG